MKTIKDNYPITLLYHQVADACDGLLKHYGITIKPDIFRVHVKAALNNYEPIGISELESSLRDNVDVRDRVLFTFDDGYSAAFKNAGEILTKYNIESIWFINSAYWENNSVFWLSKLMYIFDQGLLGDFIAIVNSRFPGSLSQPENNRPKTIDLWAKDNYSSVLEEAISEFALSHGFDELRTAKEAALFATPNQIRELPSGFEIANHTASHPNIRNIALSGLSRQATDCAEAINRKIGVRPRYFAFPFGRFGDNWSLSSAMVLNDLGYNRIFSVAGQKYSQMTKEEKASTQMGVMPRLEVPCDISSESGLIDFIDLMRDESCAVN